MLDNHFLIIRKGGRGKLGGTEGVREREFVAYNHENESNRLITHYSYVVCVNLNAHIEMTA
ncbi:MAG: hypothetical protein MJE68_10085 [Proteobacteria bacterium]|nr:hypothetical protein [Pseudomonadota bacterium]